MKITAQHRGFGRWWPALAIAAVIVIGALGALLYSHSRSPASPHQLYSLKSRGLGVTDFRVSPGHPRVGDIITVAANVTATSGSARHVVVGALVYGKPPLDSQFEVLDPPSLVPTLVSSTPYAWHARLRLKASGAFTVGLIAVGATNELVQVTQPVTVVSGL